MPFVGGKKLHSTSDIFAEMCALEMENKNIYIRQYADLQKTNGEDVVNIVHEHEYDMFFFALQNFAMACFRMHFILLAVHPTEQ